MGYRFINGKDVLRKISLGVLIMGNGRDRVGSTMMGQPQRLEPLAGNGRMLKRADKLAWRPREHSEGWLPLPYKRGQDSAPHGRQLHIWSSMGLPRSRLWSPLKPVTHPQCSRRRMRATRSVCPSWQRSLLYRKKRSQGLQAQVFRPQEETFLFIIGQGLFMPKGNQSHKVSSGSSSSCSLHPTAENDN